MEQSLSIMSQFPTIIYSILLGILIVYWLIGLLGLVDLDLAGDSDIDLNSDLDTDIGGLAGLLLTFGLTGIPLSLVISFLLLFAWLISCYTQLYLLSWFPAGWLHYFFGTLSAVVSFVLALPLTALVIKPLKGLFSSVETSKSKHLIGNEAEIVTEKITSTFGQAKVFNDGAEILLNVQCAAEHHLVKGDKVLVIAYTKESHSYVVAPFPTELT